MTGSVADRVVLVTGGSRGIGRAAVRALHRDGFHVVLHHRSSAAAVQDLVSELGDERVHVVAADLAVPGEPERLWAEALAWRGRIDVLVNNAGVYLASPLDDAVGWDAGWNDNLTINLLAPATLCRLAVTHWRGLRDSVGGIVVNVTSRAAHRGDDADHLAYGASKGGLQSLTKGIARAFARDRVLAYDIAPGWVLTDMMTDGPEADALAASMPMGEITPPEDVAEVIAFLASGRSRHTSGATIDVTGADYVR
ncbi:MAG: SDR family NAD(P)-dependent oxidoreductase [Janthinobacterium lividum]